MCRRYLQVLATALFLCASLAVAPVAHAQIDQTQQDDLGDLRRALRFIGNEYADNYVQPVTDAFGANMNGGLFRDADVGSGFLPVLPIDVYVGVSLSAVQTETLTKRFTPPATENIPTPDGGEIEVGFTEGTDAEVPTAFGKTETPSANLVVTKVGPGGSRQQLLSTNPPPGLIDVGLAPLPIPQARVGTVAGTDVQLRYFPESSVYGYGKVGLFGVALRHDIDQWFPAPLPLDLAVQGAWNQFSLSSEGADGEFQQVLDASGWAFNLHASRGVPILPVSVYAGLQFESFSTSYSYQFDPPNLDSPIDLSLDQNAANSFRGLAGVAFNIPLTPIRFNADYAIGSENNVVTAGFGVKL